MIPLTQLLEFSKLINSFKQVRRKNHNPGTNEFENDAEHSYQLAMTAWYLIEANNLNLDVTKVLKYALVHDLVEIYAGDVCAHENEQRKGKEVLEKEACERLCKEFPEAKHLFALFYDFEEHPDPESRFVYALDRLMPEINIYLNEGKDWHELGVTLDRIIANNDRRFSVSPEAEPYWLELKKILQEQKDTLFPNN